MSILILAIAVGTAAFAIVVIAEAAWRQRCENTERQQFELALTAAQRRRWHNFEAAGGAWREFAELLQAERKVQTAGLPRQPS